MSESPTNFVPLAPIKIIRPNGAVRPYGLGASTDVARGTALKAAAAALAQYDRLIIGPGNFDLGNNPLRTSQFPANIVIEGAGSEATKITSTENDGTSFIIRPNSNSIIGRFWLDCPLTDGTFQLPIGAPSGTGALSDVVLNDLKIVGDSDCLLLSSSTAGTWHLFNCNFQARWDALRSAGAAHVINVYSSNIKSIGTSGTGGGNRAAAAATGTINIYGGQIEARDNGTQSICVQTDGGTVNLFGVRLRSSGSTTNRDIDISSGTINTHACHGSGTGGILVTNGTPGNAYLSAAGLFFTGDSDTGVYAAGTDTLALRAGGTNRATITTSGMALSTDLAVTEGGTGASTATAARANLEAGSQAPVIRTSLNGTQTGYGYGAADAAAVGTALISAQTAASSGDLIECFADATISSALGKNGVRYNFAAVTVTASSTANVVSDGGSAMSFSIDGMAYFVSSDARAISITGSGSSVNINCRRVRGVGTGSTKQGVYVGAGATLYINASSSIESADADAIYVVDGTCYFHAPLVDGGEDGIEITGSVGAGFAEGYAGFIYGRGTTTNGVGVHIDTAARAVVRALRIQGAGSAKQSVRMADFASSGTSIIDCPEMTGYVVWEGGAIRIMNATIDGSIATNKPAIEITVDSQVKMELYNCHLIKHSGAATAITTDGAVEVEAYGSISPDNLLLYDLTNVTLRRHGHMSQIELCVVPPGITCVTGDGQQYWSVPRKFHGYNIISANAFVTTAGTTGDMLVQVARVRSGTPADVLSTRITINSAETDSTTGTPGVVNTSNDDLAFGDLIRIDVDQLSTTPQQGLYVRLELGEA